ncbi:hypothetical protein AU467_04245 [Mesorhizobium loti]|uniref:WGR domain-containing protein n=1 Tax=Rhizobium loti TaxID=381 RepID=A0A101KQN2_RHILI|nr:hypothetical protein AU467_04245 [Mesorhizobium loti]
MPRAIGAGNGFGENFVSANMAAVRLRSLAVGKLVRLIHQRDDRSRWNDSSKSLDARREVVNAALMIAQPYHVYVERTDAAKNMARYYVLEISGTLVGEACLTRRPEAGSWISTGVLSHAAYGRRRGKSLP